MGKDDQSDHWGELASGLGAKPAPQEAADHAPPAAKQAAEPSAPSPAEPGPPALPAKTPPAKAPSPTKPTVGWDDLASELGIAPAASEEPKRPEQEKTTQPRGRTGSRRTSAKGKKELAGISKDLDKGPEEPGEVFPPADVDSVYSETTVAEEPAIEERAVETPTSFGAGIDVPAEEAAPERSARRRRKRRRKPRDSDENGSDVDAGAGSPEPTVEPPSATTADEVESETAEVNGLVSFLA